MATQAREGPKPARQPKQPKELSEADKVEMWFAISDRAETKAQQMWNWVQELNRTAVTVAALGKAAGVDTITAFWIKLHGTLVEIGRYYEDMCSRMNPLTPTASRNVKDVHAVKAAITAMRDSLDEDRLIWVHYRRDVECHVWQTLYERRVHKGKIDRHREFALLGGKRLHVDEFSKRARALLRKYRVDEPLMAVHFAQIVAPHTAAVVDAMRPLFERR
jgi:hypothetical protein